MGHKKMGRNTIYSEKMQVRVVKLPRHILEALSKESLKLGDPRGKNVSYMLRILIDAYLSDPVELPVTELGEHKRTSVSLPPAMFEKLIELGGYMVGLRAIGQAWLDGYICLEDGP